MPGLTHTSPVALSRRMRNDSTGPLRILHELRPIKGVMYIIPIGKAMTYSDWLIVVIAIGNEGKAHR